MLESTRLRGEAKRMMIEMRCDSSVEKRKVLNIVELGELVYIVLDDGKKYLLNGSGCWRCGSKASCFGNTLGYELEVVCVFDFFDEVRCLFLCLLQELVIKSVSWLSENMPWNASSLVDRFLDASVSVVEQLNVKKRS